MAIAANTKRSVAFPALLVALFVQLLPLPAHGLDLLILQSSRAWQFGEALAGFRSVCRNPATVLSLSELEEADIRNVVRAEKPRLVVAIGADALRRAVKVKDVPVLYMMVINPHAMTRGKRNISGVAMDIPPERYLDLLQKLKPPPRRVGLLYDPVKSGYLVKRARLAAAARKIELVVRAVHSPHEVVETLSRLKGRADALLMLPDTTAITPQTAEFILLFSEENHLPVVSFAARYVEMGAFASLDIDGFDLGKQAGEMAEKLLKGASIGNLPAAEARKTMLKVNWSVAKKLGLAVSPP